MELAGRGSNDGAPQFQGKQVTIARTSIDSSRYSTNSSARNNIQQSQNYTFILNLSCYQWQLGEVQYVLSTPKVHRLLRCSLVVFS